MDTLTCKICDSFAVQYDPTDPLATLRAALEIDMHHARVHHVRYWTVQFRMSLFDMWCQRLHIGGDVRKFYSIEDAIKDAKETAKIYGEMNVQVIDEFGFIVRGN